MSDLESSLLSGAAVHQDRWNREEAQHHRASPSGHFPWWFRLGGGGAWSESTFGWRAWHVFYGLGVYAMSTYTMIYVMTTTHPSVFAVFVVITPDPPEALSRCQQLVCVASCVVHILAHGWVACSPWCSPRAPVAAPSAAASAAGMMPAWVRQARQERPRGGSCCHHHREDQTVSVLVIGFNLVALSLLLVGNLVNPGTWSVAMNVGVWGFAGAIFVWYPFVVPFAMLVDEVT